MNRFLLITVICFTLALGAAAQTRLDRPSDPVVFNGGQLPLLIGKDPKKIVAYKRLARRWVQIPVQVDERFLQDIVRPYGIFTGGNYPASPSNPTNLVYADASTNTGADPNAVFDADDEVVFMAKDAGVSALKSQTPFRVLPGSGVEVRLTDPVDGKVGYVYLFVSEQIPDQSASVSYVSYTSNLATTSLFPAHSNGLNPESSTVVTPRYSWKLSAEWVNDFLTINNAAGVAGPDILDRYKAFFANGNCGRSEDTFSNAENAFIANKAGPVRIVRSYLGANSGPLTQRTQLFYEARQDIATDLRTHNIPSIYDVFDYAPAASGMNYCSNANPNTVTIDGQQDSILNGELTWEAVSGTQGSLIILHNRETTLTAGEATYASYYDDNASSPASNCTGDGQAFGTSGVGMTFNATACTDPIAGGCGVSSANFRTLRTIRTIYFSPTQPNACSVASQLLNRKNNPLILLVRRYLV